MTITILENACLFDGVNEDRLAGMSIAVEKGEIKEVSDLRIDASNARVIDVGGRTLMPGLIDLHVHAYASDVNFQLVDAMGSAYRTAHAVRMLGHALDCGFTTVRDIGGGDWSLWRAIEDGLIRSPRFFYVGRIVSMTGGHGDMRPMSHEGHGNDHGLCRCGEANSLTVIADGVDMCITAVREEFRRGAHAIKIMGSGGVTSPTDPIWMNQYREDEVRAIVNECVERRSYVSAHCHPASAIRRCVEFGVRCIEHGTLIDDATAAFVAEHGVYVVPTMAIIFALRDIGPSLGLLEGSRAKLDSVFSEALSGMERMRQAGVKIGFGTDLLGATHNRQCTEFEIRSEIFSPIEILRQATSGSAEILQMEGKLGCIAEGAYADLIVVDGDPIKDISLLARNGQALPLIMRGGELVKNELG